MTHHTGNVERISLTDQSGNRIEIEAPVPARLGNELGEVYEVATPHARYDRIRYRLTDADREALARMAGVKPAAVPEVVEGAGHATTVGGADVIKFDQTVKGKRIVLRLDTRPHLRALSDNVRERTRAVDAARTAHRDAERRSAEDARRRRAEELQATLPAGRIVGIFQTVRSAGMDGWGDLSVYRTLDGREFTSDIDDLAAASDETQGAFGYTVYVSVREGSIARQAAERRGRRTAEARAIKASRASDRARRSELLAVEVPAEAVAAYKQCGGDPDRLPDDIDNPRYWIVRRYADAIEEQGLAYPARAARPDALDQLPDAD